MKRRLAKRSLWILAGLGILGFAISVESYHTLLVSQSGAGTWCDLGEVSSCEKAYQSEYSRLFGRPTSLYGIVTYFLVTAIAILGLANRGPYLLASLFHLSLFGILLMGATFYFAWALVFKVKTLCVLCIADYVVNLFTAGVAWYACLKLRLPYRSLVRWDARSLWGTPRNVFRTAVLGILFVILGFVFNNQEKRIYLIRMGLHHVVNGTADSLPTPWAARFPSTGPADAPIHVISFGDYQCPFCGLTKKNWNEIMEEYPGLVRMTAIHTPSNSDCSNSPVDPSHHPFACQATYLSLAILEKKGEEAFWAIHDELYDVGTQLDQMTLLSIGRNHGLSDKELDEVLRKSKSKDGLEFQIRSSGLVGVGVLPYTLINGFRIIGYSEDWALLRIIEAELERKGLDLEDYESR